MFRSSTSKIFSSKLIHVHSLNLASLSSALFSYTLSFFLLHWHSPTVCTRSMSKLSSCCVDIACVKAERDQDDGSKDVYHIKQDNHGDRKQVNKREFLMPISQPVIIFSVRNVFSVGWATFCAVWSRASTIVPGPTNRGWTSSRRWSNTEGCRRIYTGRR